MSAIEKFAERARTVSRTIVLPEGQDPRVVKAANMAVEKKVVGKIIVLGTEEVPRLHEEPSLRGLCSGTL